MVLNHKKLFTIAIVMISVAGAALSGQALAQDAATTLNIRVVDIDGVRTNSTAFKAARDQIVGYGNTHTAILQKEEKELRDANAELNRKRTLLSPEAFAEERNKFEQRVATFQSKMQEQQKIMNKLQLDAIGQINDKILQIITEYADKNNVTMILPSQSVVLRSDKMDMDAHVLERLNKELPTLTVAIPASAPTPKK
jgi:outer membrane protein